METIPSLPHALIPIPAALNLPRTAGAYILFSPRPILHECSTTIPYETVFEADFFRNYSDSFSRKFPHYSDPHGMVFSAKCTTTTIDSISAVLCCKL